jgi:hypothetical protein
VLANNSLSVRPNESKGTINSLATEDKIYLGQIIEDGGRALEEEDPTEGERVSVDSERWRWIEPGGTYAGAGKTICVTRMAAAILEGSHSALFLSD